MIRGRGTLSRLRDLFKGTVLADGQVPTWNDTSKKWVPATAYPVGAVFISVVSTNPNTLLGFGTWSAIAAGRVLVGLDSGDTDFDTAEETGGAKTVAAAGTNANESAHTHAATGLTFTGNAVAAASTATSPDLVTSNISIGGVSPVTTATGSIGGSTAAGSAHTHTFTGSATSVVQPYFVVYMWKRTA